VDEEEIQDCPLFEGSSGISDMDIKGSLREVGVGGGGGGGVRGVRQLGSAMLLQLLWSEFKKGA
jgi:hypothetical protein